MQYHLPEVQQFYTLPKDLDQIDPSYKNATIDMSTLSFAVPKEQQKRSAFIFLRNTGIQATLDFSNCDYSDKEEFLLFFLMENIEINAPMLASTWIEILLVKFGGDLIHPSILTQEEIALFVERNEVFIDEIYQFINSLPLYAMYLYNQNNKENDLTAYKETDYKKIKLINFHKLTEFNDFILLYQITKEIEPLFYKKLFGGENAYLSKIIDSLPFLLLLDINSTPEKQQKFLDEIGKISVPQEHEP
jgi:hypothetical protein